jgi:hypothetical protein
MVAKLAKRSGLETFFVDTNYNFVTRQVVNMFITDLAKEPELIDLTEEELKKIVGGDGSDPNNAFEPVSTNTDGGGGWFSSLIAGIGNSQQLVQIRTTTASIGIRG